MFLEDSYFLKIPLNCSHMHTKKSFISEALSLKKIVKHTNMKKLLISDPILSSPPVYEKPWVLWLERCRSLAQRKSPPLPHCAITVRPDKVGCLPEGLPWAQGGMRPRALPRLQASHSFLPLSSVNDLRSLFLTVFHNAGGPGPEPLLRK